MKEPDCSRRLLVYREGYYGSTEDSCYRKFLYFGDPIILPEDVDKIVKWCQAAMIVVEGY